MTDGNTYAINKHLDEREDWDALQEVTAELEQAEARIEELEAQNKRLNEQMDAIEEMGTESLNALPDCLMRLAPALVENDELKAKLAKAVAAAEKAVGYIEMIPPRLATARVELCDTLAELSKEHSDEKGQDDE